MGSRHSYVTLKVLSNGKRFPHDYLCKKMEVCHLNLAGHEISGKNSKLIT